MKKIIGIILSTLMMTVVLSQVSACTTFISSNEGNTFVGANFDWSINFDIYMQVFPADEGKFGRIIFEFPLPTVDTPNGFYPRQGINDQGLYYADHVAPYLLPINSSDKPFFYSDDPEYYNTALESYCLAKCSTVDEVLDIIDDYNLIGLSETQCFVADRNGNSIIIEGDDIIYNEGGIQVLTNFYHTHPELGMYPCWRYNTAISMLENISEFNYDYFKSICNATHQGHTVHSNVYDLIQQKIWIYYMNDFNKVIEIDLNEELMKGESRTYLGSLFEPEDNQPPEKPSAPTGEITGLPGDDFDFRVSKTTDPDNDKIMYLFDWDDGTDSDWIMPSVFGSIKAAHNWTERGDYQVKVKAKDQYGAESEWSDPLTVTMPKNKIKDIPSEVIIRFIELFPILFSILKSWGNSI